ncbi:MAG: DUF4132 domain-containing protein [Myxococcota bacterium]
MTFASIEEKLAAVRTRPPKWVTLTELPTLRWQRADAAAAPIPLSEKATKGFIADLKRESPEEVAPLARPARARLDAVDCAAFLNGLLTQWAVAGQPSRDRRWLLFAIGLLGDDEAIDALGRRVSAEIKAKRHRAAGYCLVSLARNGSPTAKRWLARWARQAPGLTLRASAWSAWVALDDGGPLPINAVQLGFDRDGWRDYDHGGRALRLRLTPDATVELFDGARPLKSVPGPRKADDPDAVRASRARLSTMKAALKEGLQDLHDALEEAMIVERPLADWRTLLLEHPLAWRASRGLIFEALARDGAPMWRFLLTEEGDAVDAHGEDLPLAEVSGVRVVHPGRMTADERDGWRDLLDEADATPPFDQLDRPMALPGDGPRPLADALAVLPAMATPRLAHGLASRGYLADNAAAAYGLIERSLKFFGPYLVVLSHEGYPANPYHWSRQRRLRLTGIEVRRGKSVVPAARLPAPVFSEIISPLQTL